MDHIFGFIFVILFPSIGLTQGIRCGRPEPIPHGNVMYMSGGKLVQYFCDRGYQPFGAPLLSCSKGKWKGQKPICVAPGCLPATQPLHSTRIEQLNGAVVRYKCNPGFRMRGSEVIYCDGSHWSAPTPACESTAPDALHTAPPYPPENAIEDPGNATESHPTNTQEMGKPIYLDPSDKPPDFYAALLENVGENGQLSLYKVPGSDVEQEDRTQNSVGPPRERHMPPATFPNQNLHPPDTHRAQRVYPPYLPRDMRMYHQSQRSRNLYEIMLPPPYGHLIYPPYGTTLARLIFLNNDKQENVQRSSADSNNREDPVSSVGSKRLPGMSYGNVARQVQSFIESRDTEKKDPVVDDSDQSPDAGTPIRSGEMVSGVLQVPVSAEKDRQSSSGHQRSCPPARKPIRGYFITKALPKDYEGENYQYLVEYHCDPGLTLVGGDSMSYCTTKGRWEGRLPRCEKVQKCETGFVKQTSGQCSDINECAENNGGCVQKCLNFPGGFLCRCYDGYQLSGHGVTCTDVDECSPARDKICNHFCQNTPGSFECSCRPGYFLMEHDKRTCLDINECLTLSPCDHLCQNTFGSFRCACRQSFRLDEDGRTCTEICQPGYVMRVNEDTNRKYCADEDECLEHGGLGNCEQVCNNTAGSYFCSCLAGYKLTENGQTCSDLNECAELSPCQYGCINTVGSYSCSCPHDQVRSENGLFCIGCQKDSYMDNEECQPCPDNSETEDIGATERRQCICKPGYRGNPGMDIPCTDIDECKDANYGCSHTCVNTAGSVFCGCPQGYTLDLDGRNCKDADECNDFFGVCGRGGACQNTEGGYNCTCVRGYRPDPRNSNACVDINECKINNGGCQARCLNLRPGYQCSCYTNYRLDRDGRSCIPLHGSCPTLQLLQNGRVLPEVACIRMDKVVMGRVCFYACNSGYKLIGQNRIQCGQNGWTGTPPQCVPEGRCPPLELSPGVRVIPPRCSRNSSLPWAMCVFSCEESSHMMKGRRSTRCIPNNKWEHGPPTCVAASPSVDGVSNIPRIQCPRDIDVDLAPGEAIAKVTLPKPVTNMRTTEQRNDGSASRNMFPAGTTSVKFTAFTSDRHRHASCVMRVHVRDKEAPTIQRCPGSISLESTHEYPEISWKPPLFSDNVGMKNVKESRFPRGNITWGSYSVSYTASDAAGNMAECAFTVTIRRPKASRQQGIAACGKPVGPKNGRAMCRSWARGVYCIPTCNSRYAFERMPPTYVCDENGIWTPGRAIPDCVDMRSARRPASPTTSPTVSLTSAYSVTASSTYHYSSGSTLGYTPEGTVNSRRRPIPSPPRRTNAISNRVSQPRLIKLAPEENNCPTGQVPRSGPGEKTCVQCPVGTYRPRIASALKCLPCLPGYYQDNPGMGYCKQCPNYPPQQYSSAMRNKQELMGLRSVEECERIVTILERSVRDAAVRKALARRRKLLRNR